MSDGGVEMARHSTSPAAGPLEDDGLLAEILLRLPRQPSSLLHASVVCTRWRRIATDAAFRRRIRARHRKPPVLGAFTVSGMLLQFVPLLDPPNRIPPERFSLDLSADGFCSWSVLGCRHGRVLLIDRVRRLLLVFEPVSGDTLRILIPPEFVSGEFNDASAAVLCAADHVHGDCHSSPFNVVLVSPGRQGGPVIARVYSREETGMWMWGDLASTAGPPAPYVRLQHCTLVGNALYWHLNGYEDCILEFDLDNQSLTLISSPPVGHFSNRQSRIVRAEDGGLCVVVLSYPSFQLWHRKVDSHGLATWMLWKTANMHEMLGPNPKAYTAYIVGYSEDSDAIFMWVHKAANISDPIIVQLESMTVNVCHGVFYRKAYHPFTNFYTTGTVRA